LLVCAGTMLHELDRRLQYGPGMRVQRLVEAGFLIAAFFSGDVRFAYVPLGLAVLQTLSARLVPVALVVAAFIAAPREHRLGDLYFDFGGTRGACAVSVCVMATGIWLVRGGHAIVGWLLLAFPTASLVLAPTVGFCCGCAVYVAMREVLAKLGVAKRYANGACDIGIDRTEASGHQ
jgi:hypothetical protein